MQFSFRYCGFSNIRQDIGFEDKILLILYIIQESFSLATGRSTLFFLALFIGDEIYVNIRRIHNNFRFFKFINSFLIF